MANWRVPRRVAEVVELGHGVSLILYDSEAIGARADPSPLIEALRRARGPWRVLAAHRPIVGTPGGARIRRAIAEAGVEVQVHVAGHEHNLQLGEPGPPGPRLEVIAGGGASTRPPKQGATPGARFVAVTTGFARVDLILGEGGERPVASLFEALRPPLGFWRSPRLLARWSVDRAGLCATRYRKAGIASGHPRARTRERGRTCRGLDDLALPVWAEFPS